MTFPACVLLTTLLATQINGKPAVHLAEGKFGKALDAAATPLAFGGDERYRTPPLTVECWAKLQKKSDFNVLVSCDPKPSSRHWEIYSYARSGAFSAYLPGYTPSEIVSKTNICDGKWHHVAMTFDGSEVVLFVDGKKVREQTVKPRPGAKPLSGPLSIGQAIDGGVHIGCDGLVDEVHLSRVIRKIELPTVAPAVDADTIGLWRFDDGEKILADPAWTPPPATTGEPWERATDVDWVDDRLRKMDTGPTFNATLRYPRGKQQVTVYKGTAIRIGDKGEGGVIFDRNQLRFAAGWVGGYLNHSDRRFGLLNTPTPAGKLLFTSPSMAGWRDPASEDNLKHPATAPLPHSWGRYQGMYLHGKRVVLTYTIGGVTVRESPWLETVAGQSLVTRTIEVGPLTTKREVLLAQLPGVPTYKGTEAYNGAIVRKERVVSYVHVVARHRNRPRGGANDRGDLYFTFWPSDIPQRIEVLYWTGSDKDFATVSSALEKRSPRETLGDWTKPGPARYPTPLVTRGEMAKDDAPYVVDTLTVPYDNPHRALFFCTGNDFLPDGRSVVCTAHGDVWLVKHDAKLERVEWRRFATGLYQPLGLKVVDGKVVVLERGQLTRLHDLNDDGEADRYENLCHDWHTGSGEHSYDTCLETDPEGNFYFFKTGDTELPHGGCLLKVNKDGSKVSVFATGFRHPIGLGVSPTGLVTGGDQEGNWMPMTRVDVYKQGGFYGDMRAHHRAVAPKTYDGPLVWLPKDVDNSAGGQVWVPHDRFGWPKGQLLHLSYGRCKLYAMLTQRLGDVWQAGAVDLGVRFLSGSARGRFHPADGHLYVTGLNGWQTAAKRDGSLQRLRYTGKPLPMPVGLRVQSDGIRIDFAQPLAKTAAETARYRIEQCNIRWSADYGSKRWSPRDPSRQGQDVVPVAEVTLTDDGKSVFLRIKDLKPVMMMRIGYDVETADGKRLSGAIHNTIHRLEGSR